MLIIAKSTQLARAHKKAVAKTC